MRRLVFMAVVVLLAVAPLPVAGQSPGFADPAFRAQWAKTDAAVASGAANHSWVWGPAPISPGEREPYRGAPDGSRLVQYFDKGRMELAASGRVTNGLLARELMTGQVAVGDTEQTSRAPATIAVAGDGVDPIGPTYAGLGRLIGRPPHDFGSPITNVIDNDGSVGSDSVLARFGVRSSDLITETQHRLANVFNAYFSGEPLPNTEGQIREVAPFESWYITTGLPLTEAYWTRVRVAGQPRDVLVQAFERRVLTYTPANPAGSQVEMGNVGQHYLVWKAQPPTPSVPQLACPEVAPPPSADRDTGRMAILGSALHEVSGRRSVTGLIRNDGDSRSPVEVVVSRFTADGRRLGQSVGFTDRDFWPNGQVAGFRVALPSDEMLADWQVEVRTVGAKPTGGLAGGFTIEEMRGAVDGLGISRIDGRLAYSSELPFDDLAIIRLYALDACGGLVSSGTARAGTGRIESGTSVPFNAILFGAEGATQLQAVVEARTGTTSFVADDALRVYESGLFPAPVVPITGISGCCQYTRSYLRPDGTPVRSEFKLTPPA